jgi:hypothetical protein
MRLIGQNNNRRKVYAEHIADGYVGMSPFPEVRLKGIHQGKPMFWRPLQLFDTAQELEQEASSRDCEVVWQAS